MQHMLERAAPDTSIGIAQRTEFVLLVLKQIRVDRSRPNAILFREALYFRHIVKAAWKVPKHMQCKRRRDARQCVNLGGIGELLLKRGGGSRLQKLAKPGACIRKSPRGNLNCEAVQACQRAFQVQRIGHLHAPRVVITAQQRVYRSPQMPFNQSHKYQMQHCASKMA
jgi:hypothetical protein